MSDKSTATTDPRQKLEQLEKELDSLATSLSRSSKFTMFITIVLLVVIGGYFIYGYSQFSALLQPEPLVDAAAGLLDDNIGPTRETLEQEIIRNAPFWAEQLSEQAIAAMPQLTDQAETYVIGQSQAVLDQMEVASMDQFRRVISEHRAEFKSLAEELKQSEDPSPEVLAEIQKAMEKELGGSMKRDAQELLTALNNLNDKLARFTASKGGSLSYDEQLERQAMMLVRYMQTEQGDHAVPVPTTAPFQGLVDRLTPKEEESESTDEDSEEADDEKKAAVGGMTVKKPAGVAVVAPSQGATESAQAMRDVAAEATRLRDELLSAVKAADAASGEARSAATTARDQTAAAEEATEELRAVIKQARAALEKVEAAKKDAKPADGGTPEES